MWLKVMKVVFFVLTLSLLSYALAGSEAFSWLGDITPKRKQKIIHQEDQAKQAKYRTEVDGCSNQTRATHHKSHVGGEWGFFSIRTHQAQTLSLLTYAERSSAFLQSFSSGGAPAMNPSSLGFSRQSNLSARRCVGIPQVWVLPTQDSQTAPEQKEWNTPESLLCVVALLCLVLNWAVVKFCLPFPQQALVKTLATNSSASCFSVITSL